ncbi:apolipoprotein N-acyltransferase [Terriglobus albidus]|uniref:apolipoprotein N-acyltransferase n=1 Tax=Terriglobus albidus TaxID=1592106 RepID=UPI0021E011F1|nr:apolipoprotein N-acyltransferase [Terriglobus albidus]
MQAVSGKRWALTLGSGVLQVLIFPMAGPVPAWRAALCWLALAPLLVALLDAKSLKTREFATLGYACGILWYLGSCYWVMPTMYLYGGMSKPAGFGILLLFALYLGLYHALFALLIGLLRRFWSAGYVLCASPFVWVAVELARARITSFPWDQLGVAQVDNPLLTLLAPWGGVYAMSFVIAAVNALVASWWVLERHSWKPAVAGLCLTIALHAGGWVKERRDEHRSRSFPQAKQHAVLLQGNLAESGPEAPRNGDADSLLTAFVRESIGKSNQHPQIIIWPESPAPFATSDPTFRQKIGTMAQITNSAAIIGAEGIEMDSSVPRGYKAYNSAALFAADGSYRGHYDKIHLVPFGEYLPFASIFQFAGGLVAEVGESDRGHFRIVFRPDGHGYGTFICYESIFADEVRQFVKGGAEVLVNISNDGWYGDTSAPWQHLNMARMRAIENRRWVLRDTNTGLTGAIDPYGHLREQAPRHIRTAIAVGFDYADEMTFYTRFGDLFAYGCCLVVITLLGYGGFREKRTASGATVCGASASGALE